MERKEAYEQIKKLGLQEMCKKMYSKNFTQCKTSELEYIIDMFGGAKVATEVKPIETVTKNTTKVEEPKDSFNKLLDILMRRHLLLEADIKEILG